MASNFQDYFGAGGGKILGPMLTCVFYASGTFTAPTSGYMVVRGVGAGGGGGRGSGTAGSATGGGSGSWGARIFKVAQGDTAVFTIGAGGAGAAGAGSAGAAGGTTTIVVGAVTMTIPGGGGGLGSATPALLAGPNGGALPTNCDFGAAGSKAGNTVAIANTVTGGAGVNIFVQPGNPTRSGNTTGSAAQTGGGGVYSASPDSASGFSIGGGSGILGRNAGGEASSSAAPVGASFGWPLSLSGGGGQTNGAAGGPGGGGAGSSSVGGAGGLFGGGGGGSSTGGAGGIGGGGGGCGTASAAGGDGFGCVEFYADMGLA